MKTGTSQAILTTELFAGDGPYRSVADDFVAQRCSVCGGVADDEVRFFRDGYYCSSCWSHFAPAS